MTAPSDENPVNQSTPGGVYRMVNAAENAVPDLVIPGANEARAVVAQMYRENYTSLVRTIALLVRDATEAEDIVQEAHLRLYRSWDRLHDVAAAPGYLRATAINLARSRLRTLIRARRRTAEPEPTVDPHEEATAGAVTATVIAALKSLPPRQRECLALRYYLELTDSEIANDLGISIGSVKQHVSRGLEKLEQALERYR